MGTHSVILSTWSRHPKRGLTQKNVRSRRDSSLAESKHDPAFVVSNVNVCNSFLESLRERLCAVCWPPLFVGAAAKTAALLLQRIDSTEQYSY